MADLNALIAQGAQFRIPPPVDPMGNMPQLMQMRSAQNQNALAQYQLGAAQRTDEQQSALNALARDPNFNPNTPEGMRQAQQYGAPGYALVKSAREASSAGVAQDQARASLLKEKMAMLPDAYRMADTPEAYAQLQESIHADPVIGPWLNSIGATREKGVAALQDALAKPNGFDQLRMGSMQSVKDILEGNKPLVVAAGSSVFNPKSQSFVGTAPEKTPTYAPSPDQQGYDVSRAQGYKGTFLDYKKELALAGRAAVAEPAPTITQVVDPKNPKQMLNVNARLYGGGSMGDPGVIGVAGREPGYVAREEKAVTKQTETDKSRGQVDNLVAQLGNYYDALSNEGGITSTGLRAGSNAMAGLASSGLGQATGRLFGTQAQSQRNSIVQTRPLLVQAIKNATGMSAKQMDSNVELKMMLATATDPTLDLEANRRALANLAALYGTGGGAAPPPAPSPGAPTRANAAKGGWGQIQVVTP
mgnify:CR=1 FL=1